MGQTLSLCYSVADSAYCTHPCLQKAKQVSYIVPPADGRGKQQNDDAKSSCSSLCGISDEGDSEYASSSEDDDMVEDLPFYHSESLGLSEYFNLSELPEEGLALFQDDDDDDEAQFLGPLFINDEKLPEPSVDVDALPFFEEGSFEIADFKVARINKQVVRDIAGLDLFQDLDVLPDEVINCLLCGHNWTVLAPDFNGIAEVKSFEDCPKCKLLDLDQELCQTYEPKECPICMDECTYDDVTLNCTHCFHEDCLTSLLQQKWTTDRIQFNFLNCPCCRAPMDRGLEQGHVVMNMIRKLDIEQIKKGVDRLALVSLENQIEAVLPEMTPDEFAQMEKDNKLDIAYRKLAFYECKECEYPFFGGLVDCVADMEASQQGSQDRKCLNCSVGKSKAKCGCDLENLIFKCMCCCSPATYHCGGTEFYCNRCHDDLYTAHPCPGPGKCPLGIVHPENCVGTIGGGKAVTPFAIFCKTCGPLGHLWDCAAGEDMAGLDKN